MTASAKVQNIVIGNHASRATFTLPDVSSLRVRTSTCSSRYDTGGGHFQVVGSSTGPAGANESVTLTAPPAGNYEVWVYGFQVSAADTTTGNAVGVDIVQGNDLTVTGVPAGPVPANTPDHAARHLRERRDLGEPVRGRDAARPARGSDGGHRADHGARQLTAPS